VNRSSTVSKAVRKPIATVSSATQAAAVREVSSRGALDPHRPLAASTALGFVCLGDGLTDSARRHFEQALGVSRQTGDRWAE